MLQCRKQTRTSATELLATQLSSLSKFSNASNLLIQRRLVPTITAEPVALALPLSYAGCGHAWAECNGSGRAGTPCLEVIDECSRYGLDVDFDGAGALDDAGAGVLLWRSRAVEERAEHDDDEFHLTRVRRSAVGGDWLFARIHRGQQLSRERVQRAAAGRR